MIGERQPITWAVVRGGRSPRPTGRKSNNPTHPAPPPPQSTREDFSDRRTAEAIPRARRAHNAGSDDRQSTGHNRKLGNLPEAHLTHRRVRRDSEVGLGSVAASAISASASSRAAIRRLTSSPERVHVRCAMAFRFLAALRAHPNGGRVLRSAPSRGQSPAILQRYQIDSHLVSRTSHDMSFLVGFSSFGPGDVAPPWSSTVNNENNQSKRK